MLRPRWLMAQEAAISAAETARKTFEEGAGGEALALYFGYRIVHFFGRCNGCTRPFYFEKGGAQADFGRRCAS
jgi:hypothetical protein